MSTRPLDPIFDGFCELLDELVEQGKIPSPIDFGLMGLMSEEQEGAMPAPNNPDVQKRSLSPDGYQVVQIDLGPHFGKVYQFTRPEGGQAVAQSDFNAIGAAVWKLLEEDDADQT